MSILEPNGLKNEFLMVKYIVNIFASSFEILEKWPLNSQDHDHRTQEFILTLIFLYDCYS